MHLENVSKSFGGTRAVDHVSAEIRSGEIVALAGENGAGKTTLMRIVAGELTPDEGTIRGNERVELVHQHFMLVPEFTIAENLALASRSGFRFVSDRLLQREAEVAIAASGIDLRDTSRRVGDLSVGEKSKLELIKAVARKPSILVLDEPTSVLTPQETEELFRVMRSLAAKGTAVVFISHKLPEVMSLAERIIVMRRGMIVLDGPRNALDGASLARAMLPDLDHDSLTFDPPEAGEGESIAAVGGLQLRAGRIAAIVGVAGNGQRELARTLREKFKGPTAGHIPEDRTRDGIVAQMSIAENLALRAGRWNRPQAASRAAHIIAQYGIRASGPHQLAGSLSGGNQQKVILARELSGQPGAIIAAEPTRGLDIEAARFVRDELRKAARRGAAVVLITSDLDEAFEVADTIQVIFRGKLSEPMSRREASGRVAEMMAGIG